MAQTTKMDFCEDFKQILISDLTANGFTPDQSLDAHQITRQHLYFKMRYVEPKPRNIFTSTIAAQKITSSKRSVGIQKLLSRIKNGDDITSYLSTRLQDLTYNDALMNDWKIHHFHLGENLAPGTKFIERTSELMFARIEDGGIYVVDILDHNSVDSFANQALIETIHSEWPDLIARYKIKGQLASPISNDDVHNFRKAGVQSMIQLQDGTTYAPSGGGYATDGSSFAVTIHADRIFNFLYACEDWIQKEETQIRQAISSQGGSLPPVMEFTLNVTTDGEFGALLKGTNFRVPLGTI